MTIAISGAGGLVGSALCESSAADGVEVRRLVRSRGDGDSNSVLWSPSEGTIDSAALEGVNSVIHLAGESIAGGRWSEKKKSAILDSRVQGTKLLAKTIASFRQKPKVMVSASAVGFYGSREDVVLDEYSRRGTGFLAEVCEAWEGATSAAEDAGIRVVHLRFGMVLAAHGGALKKMLLPFRLGLGGVIGSGRQYMSWISLDDLIKAIRFALVSTSLSGPINATAPEPVTNREFTKALGAALRRPTAIPLPAFAARLALGEMADELLLSSARAVPRRLLDMGFEFEHPSIGEALTSLFT